MKKIVFMMTMMLTFGLAFAQGQNIRQAKGQPQDNNVMTPDEMTKQMTKQLGLSSSQKKKVKSLNNKYSALFTNYRSNADKGQNLKAPGKAPRNQSVSKSNKSKSSNKSSQRAAYEKELKSILSSSQYAKYQKQFRSNGQSTNNKRLSNSKSRNRQLQQ